MSRWTDEELRELITLWPTHSVRQVANRLRRPRWAILSKAKRLRLDGLPPHNPSEGVDVGNPPKRRPLKAGSYCRSGVRSRLPPGPWRQCRSAWIDPQIKGSVAGERSALQSKKTPAWGWRLRQAGV